MKLIARTEVVARFVANGAGDQAPVLFKRCLATAGLTDKPHFTPVEVAAIAQAALQEADREAEATRAALQGD